MSAEGFPIRILVQIDGDTEALGSLSKLATETEKVEQKASSAAAKTESLGSALVTAGSSFSAAAASAFSLYQSYDNLEKVQLRSEQASLRSARAQEALKSAQSALNELTAEGVTSGEAYEAAKQKVALAEENARLAAERSRMAQEDVNEAYAQFAITVGPEVASVVTNAIAGFTSLRAAHLSHAAATLQSTIAERASMGSILSTIPARVGAAAATVGHTAATVAHTVAAWASVAATNAAAMAMRILMIASGPIGWIILGIATVVTLFATNAFGLRDALFSLANAIWEVVKPALEWIWGAFQVAAKGITDFFKPAVNAIGGGLQWLGEQLGIVKPAQEAYAESTKQAGAATQEAVPQIQSFDEVMAQIPTSTSSAATSIQGLGTATDSSMAQMAGAVEAPKMAFENLKDVALTAENVLVGSTETLGAKVHANLVVIVNGVNFVEGAFQFMADMVKFHTDRMHLETDAAFKKMTLAAQTSTTATQAAFTTMANGIAAQLVLLRYGLTLTQTTIVLLQTTAAAATVAIITHFNSLATVVSANLNTVRVQILSTNASMQQMAAVAASATSQAVASFNTLAAAGSAAMARLSSAVAANMASIQSSVNAAIARVNALQAAISGLQSKSITVTTNFHEVRTTEHRSVSTSVASASRSAHTTRGGIDLSSFAGPFFRGQHGLDEVFNRPSVIQVAEGGRPEYVHVEPLTSAGVKAGGSLGGRGGEIVLVNIIEVDGVEVARAVRRHQMAGYSGLT